MLWTDVNTNQRSRINWPGRGASKAPKTVGNVAGPAVCRLP
jgi:hypothetical protein